MLHPTSHESSLWAALSFYVQTFQLPSSLTTKMVSCHHRVRLGPHWPREQPSGCSFLFFLCIDHQVCPHPLQQQCSLSEWSSLCTLLTTRAAIRLLFFYVQTIEYHYPIWQPACHTCPAYIAYILWAHMRCPYLIHSVYNLRGHVAPVPWMFTLRACIAPLIFQPLYCFYKWYWDHRLQAISFFLFVYLFCSHAMRL